MADKTSLSPYRSFKRIAAIAFVTLGIVALAGQAIGGVILFPVPDSKVKTGSEGSIGDEGSGSGFALKNLSMPPGIDTLSGIAGEKLDRDLVVQITKNGKPVSGEKITFLVVSAPSKSEDSILSDITKNTDSEGKASTELKLGSKDGQYVVAAFHTDDLSTSPVRFTIDAKESTWVMFLLFGLLGGLGIFIMGMEMSGDGLKRVAGDRMRGVLSALTSKRVLGLFIGIVATAILQSSSATTVMLVGFVSATMMNLAQAIGVTLGAKIGTTITAQLIAFNLAEYSLLLVAFGFLLQVAGKKKRVKQTGTIILGFGLIFFGLGVMGSAMRPLRSVPAFSELLVSLGEKPLLGVLVAVGFTAIVQSSAATIGLAIALCSSGLLSLEAALPLAWGAHIGTCATALLSSIGTGREGKQVAVSHLILSIVGVVIAFPFLSYFIDASRWITSAMGSSSVARELANGHMIFTVVTGLVLLTFVKQFEWITLKLVPPSKAGKPFGPKYLSEASLDVPVLALELAHREMLRLMGIVRGMMADSMEILSTPDEESAEKIIAQDDKVDILEKSIRPFLATVAQKGLSPELSGREHGFIYIVQDLEGIGDIVSKEIASVGKKMADKRAVFSEEGLVELRSYHEKLMAKLDRVAGAVENTDRAKAEETLQLGFKERIMERKLRESHLTRLHSDRKETVETSAWHLSILNNLRAIGEKLDDIARTVLEEL